MLKKLLTFTTFLLLSACGSKEPVTAKPQSGTIQKIANFSSQYVASRDIDVWLPENYDPNKVYEVLYMHDGQMLFDASTTWNKKEWRVDEVAAKLQREGKVKPFIVVGIYNSGETRYPEYFPQKVYENLSNKDKAEVQRLLGEHNNLKVDLESFYFADNYALFLVKELIPYIEQRFSVHQNAANRYLAGSSMGGLISWYILMEYPQYFAGAACLSTHWPGMYTADNPFPEAFAQYIKSHLPKLDGHKIYFDIGDQTLDALYPPLQKRVDTIMAEYPAHLWKSEFFAGAEHDENAWAARLHIPLIFLLGNE